MKMKAKGSQFKLGSFCFIRVYQFFLSQRSGFEDRRIVKDYKRTSCPVSYTHLDTGNTVVVIEHNLDLIKTADYIIDLGPEGGDGGGMVVAKGTPEQVAQVEESYTGQYLKKVLQR